MSILGVNGALGTFWDFCQYAGRLQETTADGADFAEWLKSTAEGRSGAKQGGRSGTETADGIGLSEKKHDGDPAAATNMPGLMMRGQQQS